MISATNLLLLCAAIVQVESGGRQEQQVLRDYRVKVRKEMENYENR